MIYKVLKLFFNNLRDSDLDKISIHDLYYVFYFIELYVKEIIIEKFRELNKENYIEIEESIFDDFDKENGYVIEEHIDIYENLINLLNDVFRFSIKHCKNSLRDCLEINLVDLLDYVKSEIEYLEEHKDDSEDYLEE
ncbi:hypothetical protein M4I33_13075 [Clostridium sp. LY3-2]|uniref:hypothetical protein n=1 Tax=Clostridium sp. LY3-2 TaxID=2942482 RepID=UPI0021531B57|nr:hypothetical protein [Clostridium sp. LY3-2]MCR6515802.1 hypothetical protein [Clostridium sp. LY3-2]